MARRSSRSAVAALAVLALLGTASPAVAAAGLTVDARLAVLGPDRTRVVLVGTYSCGPFSATPTTGVVDLGVAQVVAGTEVRAIGYLTPTRCDGAPHLFAQALETFGGATLRRGPATWGASGYVEDPGGGSLQTVHVPPTPIRIR
jgi:hypothetical protein